MWSFSLMEGHLQMKGVWKKYWQNRKLEKLHGGRGV
jgi:hypothetical protein